MPGLYVCVCDGCLARILLTLSYLFNSLDTLSRCNGDKPRKLACQFFRRGEMQKIVRGNAVARANGKDRPKRAQEIYQKLSSFYLKVNGKRFFFSPYFILEFLRLFRNEMRCTKQIYTGVLVER